MTCRQFEDRLSAYLDDELPRWSRWKVRQHLHRCAHCAEVLRNLVEVDNALLAAAEAVPGSEYVTQSVMLRLPAMPPPWRPRARRLAWAAGLAMACVQLAGLFGVYQWGFSAGFSRGVHGTPAPAKPFIPPAATVDSPAADRSSSDLSFPLTGVSTPGFPFEPITIGPASNRFSFSQDAPPPALEGPAVKIRPALADAPAARFTRPDEKRVIGPLWPSTLYWTGVP